MTTAREHRNHAAAVIDGLAQRWRGQLDVDGTLLPCLHPGSPDRLMLQRIAADD